MTDTKTAEKAKLSVIPKGHWRNVWGYAPRWRRHAERDPQSDPWLPGTRLSKRRWPTAEAAEQGAQLNIKMNTELGCPYLGAEFFPDP